MPEPDSIKKKRHIQALVELTWQWENTQAKSYKNSESLKDRGSSHKVLGLRACMLDHTTHLGLQN
jgi:hypothetical protein